MASNVDDLLKQMRAAAADRRRVDQPSQARRWQDRAADAVAATVGSWRFVITQSMVLIGWLLFNSLSSHRVDPYPFILLNLLLSFQAAYTAPIIMMSQNRQSEIDRRRAVDDYRINCKAELEIELLHEKIDLLREREIAELSQAVAALTQVLQSRPAAG